MLLHFEDDYARALSLISAKLEKSRKIMIEDLMKQLVDQNPEILAMVRKDQNLNLEMKLVPDRPSLLDQPHPIIKYKMFDKSGGYDFMEGINPGDALSKHYGRKYTNAEFVVDYERYEIVKE